MYMKLEQINKVHELLEHATRLPKVLTITKAKLYTKLPNL